MNPNEGLNITPRTSDLADPYSVGFSLINPYINEFRKDIVPYTTFFTDDLIKGFTSKTKGLYENTAKLYKNIAATNHLGNSNCTNKCSDPVIVQRMMEQYNVDNTPTERYGQTQNSIINFVRAATDSNNMCKVIFENKQDLYGDYYLNDKTSSNYMTVNNLYLKQIQMKSDNQNSCVFYPIPNQSYDDISASDIVLSSADDFNTYLTPDRTGCLPPNCRNPTLYQAAFADYEAKTGHTINSINQSMSVGNSDYTQSGICDYLINQDLNFTEGTLPEVDTVLRVTYTNNLYSLGQLNCDASTYSYKPDNFQLFLPDTVASITNDDVSSYSIILDSYGSNAPPILSYDPTDTAIAARVNTTVLQL